MKEQLSRFLTAWLKVKIQYEDTPGLVVGVFAKQKVVVEQAFGYRDLKNKQTLDVDSQFRVASMSKMITAIAVMQLVENHQLNLDKPISNYLEDFQNKTITCRQLLSHTSGLSRDFNKNHWMDDSFVESAILMQEYTNEYETFETNQYFKYSNAGFALLGKVIEQISGNDFESYVNESIFNVLNMDSTSVDYIKENRLTSGFERVIPGTKRAKTKTFKTGAFAPATGMISTSTDLLKLMSEFASTKPKLLSKESYKELWRVQANIDDSSSYGLGFEIEYLDGEPWVGHTGGFTGFSTSFLFNQKTGKGVVVLANSTDANSYTISKAVVQLLSEISTDKIKYKELTGVYRNRWGDSSVAQLGKKLLRFNTCSDNPVNNHSEIKQTKSGYFLEHENSYGSTGELVEFKKKQGKVTGIVIGGSYAEKIV